MFKSVNASRIILAAVLLSTAGCNHRRAADDSLPVAESLISAFYAWDAQRVATLVVPGADRERILYYQGWAEAANYEVLQRRPCEGLGGSTVRCAITVTDDFGTTLGYTATDTFTITVRDGRVANVTFEGDDPPIFEAVFGWMSKERPEVFTGPCRDMFNGGTTPGACARAVAEASRDFVAREDSP